MTEINEQQITPVENKIGFTKVTIYGVEKYLPVKDHVTDKIQNILKGYNHIIDVPTIIKDTLKLKEILGEDYYFFIKSIKILHYRRRLLKKQMWDSVGVLLELHEYHEFIE